MGSRKNEALRDTPLYRMLKRRAEIDDIRQAKAGKRRKFWYDALRLDDVLKNDNGNNAENAALGDGGLGAETIINQVSASLDGIEADYAPWRKEFHKAAATFSDKELAILRALKHDYTDRGAANLVGGISHMTVHRFKAKLRKLLLPAYQRLRHTRQFCRAFGRKSGETGKESGGHSFVIMGLES